MLFTIHRNREQDRVIRMGQAATIIPLAASPEIVAAPLVVIETPPVVKKRGRPKKVLSEASSQDKQAESGNRKGENHE